MREAEGIARRIAFEKVRSHHLMVDPEVIEIEEKLTEALGTRGQIEKKEKGGKIHIDYFSNQDLRGILDLIKKNFENKVGPISIPDVAPIPADEAKALIEDKPQEEVRKEEESDDAYNLDNFSI